MSHLLLPALVVGSILGGCLAVPDGKAPECKLTSDCDTVNGEVCDEGVCYGNPPAGMFVAIVSPPSERKAELVSRELSSLEVASDGQLGDIALEEPVTYMGQLRLLCPAPLDCSETKLGASISVTRPSLFSGGPGFSAVVQTEPRTGKFELVLPRTRDNDAPFSLTVVPEGRGDAPPTTGELTPARMVPPLRMELAVAESQSNQILDLGAVELPTVRGTLTSSNGVGLRSYRVVALGRWELDAPLTEVSTIDYTASDGEFELRLSQRLVGPVEIVAQPYGPELQPTLRLANVPATGSVIRNLIAPSGIGRPFNLVIPVEAKAPGGQIGPVSGALVIVSASVPSDVGATVATLTAQATTNEQGDATLTLFDGAMFQASYRISVMPVASAAVGVVFDHELELAALTQRLPDRMAMRGIVRDIDGAPLKDVQVTVHPSLRFQWSLDASPQAFLSAIPAATTVTLETGEFVVFVDPFLNNDDTIDIWGTYDLAFEPTATANAPSWIQGEVEIPRDSAQTTVTLPDITLPDAAHVRGRITDPSGNVVEGSELKIFRVDQTFGVLCSEVKNAPTACPIPALLMGRGTSDADGHVRLTLPRD